MPLQVGDTVPDCSFLRPDDTTVRLSAFVPPALAVIFLRHLA
jgi:hypothetical protein